MAKTINVERLAKSNATVLAEILAHITGNGWTEIAGHSLGSDTIVVEDSVGMVVGVRLDPDFALSIRPVLSSDAYATGANLTLGASVGYTIKVLESQVSIHVGGRFLLFGFNGGGTPGENGTLSAFPLDALDAVGTVKGHIAISDVVLNAGPIASTGFTGYAFFQNTQTEFINGTTGQYSGVSGITFDTDAANSELVLPYGAIAMTLIGGVYTNHRPISELLTVFHDNALIGTTITIDTADDYVYFGRAHATSDLGFYVKNA